MEKRKAFTLVELLVVISIIALLVSILMPALGKARDQAILVKCNANLHQMGLAEQLYAGDYDDRLTPGDGAYGDMLMQPQIWWAPKKTDGVCNLGYLLSGKYLPLPSGEGHVIYCPARKVRPSTNLNWTYYGDPGFSGWGIPGSTVASGYEFRDSMDGPFLFDPSGSSPANDMVELAKQSKGMLASKLSTSSIMSDIWAWSDGGYYGHKGLYNVVGADGSSHRFEDRGSVTDPATGMKVSTKLNAFLQYDPSLVSPPPNGADDALVFAIIDNDLGFKRPTGLPMPFNYPW